MIQLVVWDAPLVREGLGWGMSGKPGFEKEPLYGFTNLKQLYSKANPEYQGRFLVPTLWDKKKGMLVGRGCTFRMVRLISLDRNDCQQRV